MTTCTADFGTPLVTVKLHGFLARKYAEEVQIAGNTVQQIMNGLKHIFGPSFKEDIRTNDWHLVKGDDKSESPLEISDKELSEKLNNGVLHLIPVLEANKRFVQIIIGIILVAAVFYGYGTPQTAALGWSLIIGGVINLLFAPKPPRFSGGNDTDTGSYVFNGAVNITSQGGTKPILVGRVRRAGSVVISSDFSTDIIPKNVDTGTGSTDPQLKDTYTMYYEQP